MLRVNRGTVKSLAGSRGRCVCVWGGPVGGGRGKSYSAKEEKPET